MADEEGKAALREFLPPSIHPEPLFKGQSYTHYSPCPQAVTPASDSLSGPTQATECVLGVDEAGRGPVLGPMVYSAFYLPATLHKSLLSDEYHFDDSKVLTPAVRTNLMRQLCTPGHRLHESCGWAVKLLTARDISAGMLRPGVGGQNLNAQAMEATVEIIRDIVERSAIRVTEVYIDTIGNPASYQKRLEQIFPALKITVAKKADSLYPCVSAASVCAKVTRDIALEVSYDEVLKNMSTSRDQEASPDGWGSGYPSDSKCVNWLKRDMHSLFGWGNECRFSWGTAKEMLEGKKIRKVEWPEDDDAEGMRMTDLFAVQGKGDKEAPDELRDWFGCRRAEIL